MANGSTPAWLEIAIGDAPVRRQPLATAPLRIGRDAANEIVVEIPQISRQHAEIRPAGSGYEIRDLGSRAGVFVNASRTPQQQLRDGDVVELGPGTGVRITFRAASVTKSAAPTDQAAMAHLARFFEFSRKLGGSHALDEVLCEIVDLAIAMTGAERGMLVHAAAETPLAVQIARNNQGLDLARDGLKVSETLVRQAVRDKAPVVVADAGSDTVLSQVQSIVSLELRSAVILPLSRPNARTGALEAFAVLYLDSRRRRGGLDSLDLKILERLAHDTSAALENARLLRDAEDKRRMEQEVATAREVQAALMPDAFDPTPAFDVAGVCLPCLQLGGDYVDQFDLGGGRSLLVVADVCGKGIAASLLAAALQGALGAEIAHGRPIAEVIARVNRVHCSLAPIGKFITLVAAALDADGRMTIVDAGHCHPIHVHAGGAQALSTSGMALGLDEDTVYRETSLQLAPGDCVVLYSDGLVECEGPGRELYGQKRLEALLAGMRGRPAADVVDAITADLVKFRAGTANADDLSILVARRR